MGAWAWYFFGKLYLAVADRIDLHVVANLAFALLLVWPLPARRWLRVLRQIVALPAGLALLYYDSRLPPLQTVLARGGALAEFSPAYLLELAGRLIDWRVIAVLTGIGVAVWLLGRKLRLASFVFAGLLLVPLVIVLKRPEAGRVDAAVATPPQAGAGIASAPLPAATPALLDAELDAFYRRESGRRTVFSPDAAAPLDLVILHICSLAQDDLDTAGLPEPAFVSQAPLRLRHFNTAASYSGPAAARLLQSACGQTPESELYKPRPPECLLANQLRNAGFELQLALNHDGHFDDFLGVLRERGGWTAAPTSAAGLPVRQHAFDGSPLYGDYDVLARWWQHRLTSDVPRVALYYNSLSLHDGNRVEGQRFASGPDSYRQRAQRLFDDLQRFSDQVEQSGRTVAIVLVPEHGANLRGDRRQIPGLREIPSPAITQAPAAVRLINFGASGSGAVPPVDRPTGLFGLTAMIAALVKGPASLADYAAAAQETTPVVAENDRTLLMRHGEQWWMRTPDGQWTLYEP